VLDLTQAESNYAFNILSSISRPGRGETDNQKINLCGGIVLFRTEAVIKIGGWPEIFEGWGGEDDFQTHKVKKFGLTYKEMPYKCYHLWHERGQTDMSNYQKTIQMLQQLVTLDDNQLTNHINSMSGKMGMINKYS
jgi:predicted glycosyltransferase involved in capsule biosynthesis